MDTDTDTLLSRRLRELPQLTPPENGFALISAQLALSQEKPERRRWFDTTAWLGLAASVALAALLLSADRPAPSSAELVEIPPQVLALMQRSQALEAEIKRVETPDVDELRFALESAIQSDLALIDVGLAGANRPDAQLWAERVRLLEELRSVSQTDTGTLLIQASVD
jgi:hypothetical protein